MVSKARKIVWISIALLIFTVASVYNQEKKTTPFPVLKGPYLGQKPPGMTAELFAPGIVSTPNHEINAVFSPDGKEFYFSPKIKQFPGSSKKIYTIMFMKEEENGWTKPRQVSFAGKGLDADMFITHDGKKLFFCSDRPLEEGGEPKKDADIWFVERRGNRWSRPKNLGPMVNTLKNEYYPTITRGGTLYFSSTREGGKGKSDIYCSAYVNGAYQEAKNLGDVINTKYSEGDVFIAPDESYLIVVSGDRPDGHGETDLYISFRNKDRSWTEAKNMGKSVNSFEVEYCPMLSYDGKYFFFTSRRRGNDDIYWVDARVIAQLKTAR
jgi:Tol biopolymer transport system component